MAVLGTILIWLTTALAVAIGALYLFYKKQFSYWKSRNMPHSDPSFPMGDMSGIGKTKSMTEILKDLYERHRNEKAVGLWMFYRPAIMINDLDLIKRILIQDFSSFHDRGIYFNEKDDPLSAHLAAIEGAQWKNLRAKLSPTFTSGKMKNMFPIVADIGKKMQDVLKETAEKGTSVEAKDIIARFNIDVISSCAFGIDAKSLENPKSEFRVMGNKIFEPTTSVMIKNSLGFFMPGFARLLKLVVTPKDVAQFFMSTFVETVNYREKNDVKRNDFFQLLINLKNKGYVDDVENKEKASGDPFTIEQAAAQAFIFFIGGFETSSSALQFCLWELARNPDIQDKLRAEITENMQRNNGEITYESIHELKYLGMVLDETLRKYSIAGIITRECTKDYTIPELGVTIEKGMQVLIPAYGLQYDPRYYPQPEKFIPERFTEEEIQKRNKYSYLPFGDGPRFCIGQRFAVMQMRVAMVSIISKYQVTLGEKSPITLKIDPKSLIIAPLGGMHLYLKNL